MSLAKYLHPTSSEAPHPVIRAWETKRKEKGVTQITCRFLRERDGLTFRPAQLYVRFVGDDGQDRAAPDERLWDRRLDAWLIERGVRAASTENEIERFGYALHGRFAETIDQVGDGYFNAVLADFLRRNEELGALPEVAAKLAYATKHAPYKSDSNDCRAMIEAAIESVGRDLTERLKYSDDEATEILGGALAYDLDERFSIKNGQMLGLW